MVAFRLAGGEGTSGGGQLMSESDRRRLIGELTAETWRDPEFRELLFTDPTRAVIKKYRRVPEELQGVTFRARPVDSIRVRPNAAGGRTITVRPQFGDEPISAFTRVAL